MRKEKFLSIEKIDMKRALIFFITSCILLIYFVLGVTVDIHWLTSLDKWMVIVLTLSWVYSGVGWFALFGFSIVEVAKSC